MGRYNGRSHFVVHLFRNKQTIRILQVFAFYSEAKQRDVYLTTQKSILCFVIGLFGLLLMVKGLQVYTEGDGIILQKEKHLTEL